MGWCEVLHQQCFYTKLLVVQDGQPHLLPVCQGCVAMHVAAGAISLAEVLRGSDVSESESEDEEVEEVV